MANTKISALTALTGANLATNDQFAVVDTSATATKSITTAELKLGIMPAPGPIGGTTPSTGAFTTLSATTGAAVGGATPGAGGLAFPATAVAVANANTLDDYEEGTFTATLTGATPPTTPPTTTGYYTKIGNLVVVRVAFSNVDNTGAAGAVSITGMPFAAIGANSTGAVYFARCGTTSFIANVAAAGTTINFLEMFTGNTVSWGSTGAGIYGQLCITYAAT